MVAFQSHHHAKWNQAIGMHSCSPSSKYDRHALFHKLGTASTQAQVQRCFPQSGMLDSGIYTKHHKQLGGRIVASVPSHQIVKDHALAAGPFLTVHNISCSWVSFRLSPSYAMGKCELLLEDATKTLDVVIVGCASIDQ